MEELIEALPGDAMTLEAMRAAGVVLVSKGEAADDHAYLVTNGPDVAARFDMREESEDWGDDVDHDDERPGPPEPPEPGPAKDSNG
jgi:hypothetical protein